MIIKIERSGGLTGVPITSEVDVKQLPSSLVSRIKKIMLNDSHSSAPLKSTPVGARDYFTYKILIQDGINEKVIDCNEYTINADLKSIVKLIERGSKKKKRISEL